MKKLHSFGWYTLFFVAMTLLDRITKTLMLWHGDGEIKFSPFLSFQLCFNRGISWGMLHSQDAGRFIFVIVMTSLVTCAFSVYAYRRWKQGHSIWWETLAIAGSVSNLFDRFVHNGVIDFIAFSFGDYCFPSFNVADACIVVGVLLMMITVLKDDAPSCVTR